MTNHPNRSNHRRYYVCTGYRPIRHNGDTVRSIDDAARIFAGRLAREKYGSAGRVASIRQDTSPRNLRYANYEVYIGRSAGVGGEGQKASGRQIWLVVGVRNDQPD
jgi:hypothetical protein